MLWVWLMNLALFFHYVPIIVLKFLFVRPKVPDLDVEQIFFKFLNRQFDLDDIYKWVLQMKLKF